MTEEPFKTSLGDHLHRDHSVFSLTMAKHIKDPLSLHHSMEVEIGKNHKYEKSGVVVHGRAEEFEISCKEGIDFSTAGKPNQIKCSLLDGEGPVECGVVEMDMNQVTQSSPDSPPFCDTKGSDNDCSDQDSEHCLLAERLESSSLKRASKKNGILEKRTQLRSESSASKTEDLVRVLKRQKKKKKIFCMEMMTFDIT